MESIADYPAQYDESNRFAYATAYPSTDNSSSTKNGGKHRQAQAIDHNFYGNNEEIDFTNLYYKQKIPFPFAQQYFLRKLIIRLD